MEAATRPLLLTPEVAIMNVRLAHARTKSIVTLNRDLLKLDVYQEVVCGVLQMTEAHGVSYPMEQQCHLIQMEEYAQVVFRNPRV